MSRTLPAASDTNRAGSQKQQYRFWSEEEVSAFTGIPIRTLQDWRLRRKGPAFVKAGRLVRYDEREVECWMASRTVETAERASA
jgi:predicted DNA-binding transcriptional regulator AlpA